MNGRRMIRVLIAAGLIFASLLSMGCVIDTDKQTVEVHVDYYSEWTGTIDDGTIRRTIGSIGYQQYTITASSLTVSIQKEDDRLDELSVKIVKDGVVLARDSTMDEYGKVTISYSFK